MTFNEFQETLCLALEKLFYFYVKEIYQETPEKTLENISKGYHTEIFLEESKNRKLIVKIEYQDKTKGSP